MLTRAAPRLVRPLRMQVRRNTTEVPRPPPGPPTPGKKPNNNLLIGGVLGAAVLGWYFFMYGGKVEQKGVNAFLKNEEKIIEREHQASKEGVTSME